MAAVEKMIDQALRRVNELLPGKPERWSRDDMLDYMVDGIAELNLIACEIQKVLTVLLNTTDNVYTLDTDTIAPLACRWSSEYLLKYRLSDLDAEVDWELSATRWKVKIWVPFGLTKIIIHPRPLAPAYLHVESLVVHDAIQDDADSLSIRPEYEPAVEDFMVHRAMFKEGGAEAMQAEVFYQRFLEAVKFLELINQVRRYPGWEVSPKALLDPGSVREGLN